MHLRDYQRQQGLTLTALAARLGRPVSSVHGWLRGSRRPDHASLRRIHEATGGAVTANDFMTGSPATPDPLLAEAARLGIDAEQVARDALRAAISAEKARRWAEENRAAIAAHERAMETGDTPLAAYRRF
jgi:hypothetical protein